MTIFNDLVHLLFIKQHLRHPKKMNERGSPQQEVTSQMWITNAKNMDNLQIKI